MLFNLVLLPIFHLGLTDAFNVAPESSLYASHTPDSFFGYTVALQANPPRLIVGAPRSNSTLSQYRTLHNPGAVFSYSVGSSFSSNNVLTDGLQLTLETAGESYHDNDKFGYWDRKENAWIGGALDVANDNQNLVACGSGWKNQIHDGFYLMNGVCYSMSDSRNFATDAEKLIPLLNRDKQSIVDNATGIQLFYYSYGQAGFSVHLTTADEIVVGAPGVYHWKGSIVFYDKGSHKEPVIPNPQFTPMNLEYLGYSVSSGTFLRNKRLIVASAPRTEYFGTVLIFDFPREEDAPLDVRAQLKGHQMGEYFGAIICVADIDSDGLDDIMVAAPFYSASDDSHDTGIVYVYLNSQIWNGQVPTEIKGKSVAGGRFGAAVSAIGDLDLDGFPDIAVGAPFEDHGDTTGSIYIYRGSSSGLRDAPSQVIKAVDMALPLQGFGISISRGLDVDGNKYPDIAVGAYESSHAVVMRTRPIVRLQTRMERSISRIHSNTSQFIVEVCISYEGKYLPKYPYLVVNVQVTADKIHRRTVVDRPGNVSIELRAPTSNCLAFIVRLPLTPSDWPTHLRYAAVPIVAKSSLTSACPTCPMMDPASNTTLLSKLPVMSVCDKEECVPEWQVAVDFLNILDPFVIGSKLEMSLRIKIRNVGDNSRLLRLNISIPSDIQLRTVPSLCEKGEKSDQWYCLSGLRIDHGDQKILELTMDLISLNSSIIQVNASAQSFDSNTTVDASASVHAVRISRIGVTGNAPPTLFFERQSAPRAISHSYQVYCSGYTPVPGLRVALTVPSRVQVRNEWHNVLNLTVQAKFGESDVICSESSAAPPLRTQPAAALSSFSSASADPLSCGSGEIECTVVDCELDTTLVPNGEGLTIDLKLIIDGSVLEIVLGNFQQLDLTTKIEASVLKEAVTPVTNILTTTLVGSIRQRSDPYLWAYIAVAIIVAIILLCLFILLLKKCGFFKRHQPPSEEEETHLNNDNEHAGTGSDSYIKN